MFIVNNTVNSQDLAYSEAWDSFFFKEEFVLVFLFLDYLAALGLSYSTRGLRSLMPRVESLVVACGV